MQSSSEALATLATNLNRLVAGLAPTTKETNLSLYVNQLMPALQLTHDPAEMVDFWFDRGMRPSTVSKLLAGYKKCAKMFLAEEVDISALSRSVRRRIRTHKRTWTREQAERALQESKHICSNNFHGALLLTLQTGVRLNEMQSLKWEHVNFPNHTIQIVETKNGDPRLIPVTHRLYPWLEANKRAGDQFIFERRRYTSGLKTFCRTAGLPILSWHELRHTVATILLDNGSTLRTVADLLGHARVSTTADIYWDRAGTIPVTALNCLP